MRYRSGQNDQRLTLYVPEGAVAGRVTRFTETGVEAYLEGPVPEDMRLRFTLHLQGHVITGEMIRLGQEGRDCRLQFAALSGADRGRIAPLIEPD